ncbi:MAG TPA: hypothetical protein VIG33_04455 [Pseudobdellovibrionaceae bacterium]|jgi:hypothetical protein
MKKYFRNSMLAILSMVMAHPAYASDVTIEQIGSFLCEVQLCKNEAVVSNIKASKYNLANLAEKLADLANSAENLPQSGRQVLRLSFHQETPDKEYVRDFRDCNLIVFSPTVMSLSSCKISGTFVPRNSSSVHQLSLGDGEIMHQHPSVGDDEIVRQQEAGWLAGTMSNK